MTKIDGGELLVRTMLAGGVDHVFTLHGGHLDSIYQACLEHNLPFTDCRHEAAVGHAAEGHARSTGKLGIALITAGPGFANALTAIVNAWLDRIPVLFIAGAPPLRDAETNPLQGGFDQVAMSLPVTKYAQRVTQTHSIPSIMAHAMRIARSGMPGPVFLEIPIDVLFDRVNEEAVKIPETIILDSAPAPAPDSVTHAVELLNGAERPVIMAGGGVFFAGAEEALITFAEKTGTPVFTNGKARGIPGGDHPLFGGGFLNLMPIEAIAGARPDVVLMMGARMGMFTGGNLDTVIPYDARIIHVDIDPKEIGRLRDIDCPIVADCRETLDALNAAASAHAWPDRTDWQKAALASSYLHREMFADALENAKAPVHPYQAVDAVVRLANDDAIFVPDGGETFTWIETVIRPRGGGKCLSMGYLGCLGTGMPMAIGAQIAHPDTQVICVVGDGAVGLNIQEFDTMVRHQLPIVVIVLNNQAWGMSLHGQEMMFGKNRLAAVELGQTRYERVAAGFGCHEEFVTEPDDLDAALKRAFDCGGPACVNIMTDQDVVAPFTKILMGAWKKESEIVLPYYDNLDA
jgi:acetolactate synthase I/II/III large subunit